MLPLLILAGPSLSTAPRIVSISTHLALAHDRSPSLIELARNLTVQEPDREAQRQSPPPALITVPPGADKVEQRQQGERPGAQLLASFDGMGYGFQGPQGTARFFNPSDNSLAVGPDHIVQIVNSRIAIFSKKGRKFKETGRCLYGPVPTNILFKGFANDTIINSGDAVVRYDQLANRWLIVLPIFRRMPARPDAPQAEQVTRGFAPQDPSASLGMTGTQVNVPWVADQPGPPAQLFVPPSTEEQPPARRGQRPPQNTGAYAMCYAVSVGPDPLGAYYRYAFVRPLFPDYPRPAIWRDGYYVPTSTGDDVIQKQASVVERDKMLRGEPAKEETIIIDGVNFLNNADIDGKSLPPRGAPNIMMAGGGTQLKKIFEDDCIYVWQYHVDWNNPANTKLIGPERIEVAPYHYLGDGQLSSCIPQPDQEQRLDSQGDKLMARLVYRRFGNQESIVAVHSVNTSLGGGGVRWYEFRVGPGRSVSLYQQGTYAPDGFFRWLPSPAMDKDGDIGIGYSFGGTPNYPGQRFAARLAGDPLGVLTLHETVLAEGEDSQRQERWEDYAQTAMDPSDDKTIWYVGDYIKKGAPYYTSRIGAFRIEK